MTWVLGSTIQHVCHIPYVLILDRRAALSTWHWQTTKKGQKKKKEEEEKVEWLIHCIGHVRWNQIRDSPLFYVWLLVVLLRLLLCPSPPMFSVIATPTTTYLTNSLPLISNLKAAVSPLQIVEIITDYSSHYPSRGN